MPRVVDVSRIGVDTGGTFTDVVAADGTITKLPSTPADPAEAVAQGAAALATLPMLYVSPCAVARTEVGYNSAVTAPNPEKYPVAKNAVGGPSINNAIGFDVDAYANTNTAASTGPTPGIAWIAL